MKDYEITGRIAQITSTASQLSDAVAEIETLLASEWGSAILSVGQPSATANAPLAPSVCEFLETRDFPFRCVYCAPLASGKLIACVATFGEPADRIRRTIHFAAARLSTLAARSSNALSEAA